MLNNLNTTIITPLSPKNQKLNESKFIHNDFCNDISPEFLNTKNKTIKKYAFNSNVQQNNDTSNFLLFTPADIRQTNNVSVNSTFTENYKTVYETNISDMDISTFSTTSTFNDHNPNSIVENKSYIIDTSSSNNLSKSYEYSMDNKVYFKGYNNNIMDNTLLNSTLTSHNDNIFNGFNGNDELSTTLSNFNLISNENLYDNRNYNKDDNELMDFENDNFNLNSKITHHTISNTISNIDSKSSIFSNYQDFDNMNNNSIQLHNITNTSTSSINNINSTEQVEPSLKHKRKFQNFDSDDSSHEIYKTKKIRVKENKILVDKTINLINKINEPTSMDNKLHYNNYKMENKNTSENFKGKKIKKYILIKK